MTHDLGEVVVARLNRERNAWLCTVRPDGSPHMTPVWFIYQVATWWIGSSERNLKVRNVVTEPRVSLALEDGVAPVVAEVRPAYTATVFQPTSLLRSPKSTVGGMSPRFGNEGALVSCSKSP